MPSTHELDTEPETSIANDSGSEASEPLLEESVSFIRPRDLRKKKPILWRTAGLVTLLIVIVVFSVAVSSSLRKLPGKICDNHLYPGRILTIHLSLQ
jgi:hypothetical protein